MTLVENVHHHTPCPPSDSLPRGTTRRSAALLISSDKWWDPPFCFSITWRIWYWYIKQSLLFVTHSKNLVTSVIKPSKKKELISTWNISKENEIISNTSFIGHWDWFFWRIKIKETTGTHKIWLEMAKMQKYWFLWYEFWELFPKILKKISRKKKFHFWKFIFEKFIDRMYFRVW